MSWKWSTDPLSWGDKCAMCRVALRTDMDGGIVIWTDGRLYHVWCLLDRLALEHSPQAAAMKRAKHWGCSGD